MKLLVVEDSERLRRSIATVLRKEGFEVDLAADGETGLALARSQAYALILLDIMLPGLDGFSFLRRHREHGLTSRVLVLSARDQTQDRIVGLNLGADDYLVKPFDFDELLARTNALLRRPHAGNAATLSIGTIEVDMSARQLHVAGTVVALTRLEFRLLELLLLRRGRVYSRAQIHDHLYDEASERDSNVVEALVYTLRRKIQRVDGPELITTRRGHGYLIESG